MNLFLQAAGQCILGPLQVESVLQIEPKLWSHSEEFSKA